MPEDQNTSGTESPNRSSAAALLLSVYLVLVASVSSWMLILLFPVGVPEWPGARGAASPPLAPAPSAAVPVASAPAVSPSGAPATPSSAAPAAMPSAPAAPAPSGSAAPSLPPAAPVAAPPINPPQSLPSPPAAQRLVYGSFHHLGFEIDIRGSDEGLVLLALLAGVLGSFMHAAQSLAMYVGNGQLKKSWVLWYALRPAIGGVLGLLFYFFLRAGLIPAAGNGNSEAVSPYGVVAFAALAGWFSKRATDKLAEIFDTLFRTAKDQDYRDPLSKDGKPEILAVSPPKVSIAQVPATGIKLVFTCDKLASQAWLSLDGVKQATVTEGGMKLSLVVPVAALKVGSTLRVTVSNPPPAGAPAGAKPTVSTPFEVPVEA